MLRGGSGLPSLLSRVEPCEIAMHGKANTMPSTTDQVRNWTGSSPQATSDLSRTVRGTSESEDKSVRE